MANIGILLEGLAFQKAFYHDISYVVPSIVKYPYLHINAFLFLNEFLNYSVYLLELQPIENKTIFIKIFTSRGSLNSIRINGNDMISWLFIEEIKSSI